MKAKWEKLESRNLKRLQADLDDIVPVIKDALETDTEDAEFDSDTALYIALGPAKELAEAVWQHIGEMYKAGREAVTDALTAEFDILHLLKSDATKEIEENKTAMQRLGVTQSSLEEDIIGIIIEDSDNIAYRVMLTARCEGMQALNIGELAQMEDAQDEVGLHVLKQWNAMRDARTRDTHRELDGTVKELDEWFETPNGSALYPGGFGVAEEDCNCRCVLDPVVI